MFTFYISNLRAHCSQVGHELEVIKRHFFFSKSFLKFIMAQFQSKIWTSFGYVEGSLSAQNVVTEPQNICIVKVTFLAISALPAL